MPNNLSICLLAPLPPKYDGRSHSCGGIGHWTQMVQSYAASYDDVELIVVDTTPKWRSIHNFSMWKRAVSGGLNLCAYMSTLLKRIVFARPDVIHMTTSGDLGVVRDLIVMAVAKIFRVPLIYHIRFGRVPDLATQSGFEWKLVSKAAKMATSVVAIDHATYSAVLQHLPGVDVALVPNCINFNSVPQAVKEAALPRVFLFAGWVVPAKGVEELLAAWAHVQRSDWRLDIAGPIDAAYQLELSQNFPAAGINFLGEKPHSEMLTLISRCDAFILPSYSEGFPNAVLEAMACGKPVIASMVGAIPEMLADEAGLLVPAKDVDSLGKAMRQLMDDSSLRASLGQNARVKAYKNYSIAAVFNRYMTIWRSVCRN